MSLSKLIANGGNVPSKDSDKEDRRKSDPTPEPESAPVASAVESFSDKIRLALVEKVSHSMSDAALDDSADGQAELRRRVASELHNLISSEAIPLDENERQAIINEVANDVLGYGPLEVLLDDPTVSEIMVNGPNVVYVERSGQLVLTEIKLRSEDQLRQIIDKIVSSIGRRIDETSPLVDARLADGSRVNAIIPPLAIDGSTLTIRKFAKEGLTAADLLLSLIHI